MIFLEAVLVVVGRIGAGEKTATALSALVFTILASAVSYRYFEQPIMRLWQRGEREGFSF
jgi:peptidoglycan/LPS O-acetylase OafA/YrhL